MDSGELPLHAAPPPRLGLPSQPGLPAHLLLHHGLQHLTDDSTAQDRRPAGQAGTGLGHSRQVFRSLENFSQDSVFWSVGDVWSCGGVEAGCTLYRPHSFPDLSCWRHRDRHSMKNSPSSLSQIHSDAERLEIEENFLYL